MDVAEYNIFINKKLDEALYDLNQNSSIMDILNFKGRVLSAASKQKKISVKMYPHDLKNFDKEFKYLSSKLDSFYYQTKPIISKTCFVSRIDSNINKYKPTLNNKIFYYSKSVGI